MKLFMYATFGYLFGLFFREKIGGFVIRSHILVCCLKIDCHYTMAYEIELTTSKHVL